MTPPRVQRPAGLLISAAASGSGKTTVTLGLIAALRAQGVAVQPFKCGPDYIDPAFHSAAAGRASVNLDSWAMTPDRIGALAQVAMGADLVIAEGAMGLFDGVARPGETGTGASADIAAVLGWPVIAVIDCSGQAQTAAAVALGLARYRADVPVAGVILNRIASPRHEALVRAGFASAGIPVLGALPRKAGVALPERHLGLVQAEELPRLTGILAEMGAFVAAHCDLSAIRAQAGGQLRAASAPCVPPPGDRVALARDAAFSFVYPHLLADWRAGGATILPFSPLQDEGPDPTATVCWLPGGYPELHAGRLAAAAGFRAGLTEFARTRPVHGECGGYMALGAGLVAADGTRHQMAGLLGLETSFAKRRMHLGYRLARPRLALPGFAVGMALRGHEFHYATILSQPDAALADVVDATGAAVAETGSFRATEGATVSGTFFHLIAPASPETAA
ncbi:cobyrinic acid a,c-diamide synthase (plasmid) [Gemmobacter aquarius]|uniref:Hydrogenobyrinate a,c-diamide synthase n=1 Tax=Paragemmobacter aquarius TaxID=2169400 RepID=A0A2S0USS8_9RHOB|nr:cobyrinate a,c-diamide synthase [Gemmobacter aquarius]AWB50868.1 cobyrinic acid a,c-diamide synthase [Gemmobacter aquarius]